MSLLLAALLAHAAERVVLVLPPGEAPAVWTTAAALGGLTVGAPQAGALVELRAEGGHWTLHARDRDGNTKSMQIASPGTPAEREDAVWLAVSLLEALPRPPDLGRGASAPETVSSLSAALPPKAASPPASPLVSGRVAPPAHAPAPPAHAPAPMSPAPPASTPVSPAPPAPARVSASAPPSPAPAPAPPASTPMSAAPPTSAPPSPAPPASTPMSAAPPTSAPMSPTPVSPPPPTSAPTSPASPAPEALPALATRPNVEAPPPPDPSVGAGTPDVPARPPDEVTLPTPSRVRAWARVGPAVGWRPATAAAAGVDLSAGIELGGSVWLGVATTWLAPRTVTTAVEGATMSSIDVTAGAWWSPDGARFAPLFGVSGGISARGYSQDAERLTAFPVARLGAEAGGVAALSDRLSLVAAARVAGDVDATLLELPDGTVEPLSPVQIDGTLTLRARLP